MRVERLPLFMLFNAIVGLKFDADWFEQEELVVADIRGLDCKIMKLTSNFGMIIRMKCKSDIMSTAQVRNKQKYDKKQTEL
jgi:hypothetical protein